MNDPDFARHLRHTLEHGEKWPMLMTFFLTAIAAITGIYFQMQTCCPPLVLWHKYLIVQVTTIIIVTISIVLIIPRIFLFCFQFALMAWAIFTRANPELGDEALPGPFMKIKILQKIINWFGICSPIYLQTHFSKLIKAFLKSQIWILRSNSCFLMTSNSF